VSQLLRDQVSRGSGSRGQRRVKPSQRVRQDLGQTVSLQDLLEATAEGIRSRLEDVLGVPLPLRLQEEEEVSLEILKGGQRTSQEGRHLDGSLRSGRLRAWHVDERS